MIREITYNIRFPFGASFDKDPSILFLKKIYQEILSCTCFNDKKCNNCIKQEKCIYYLLSGENFSFYPSICVKRNFVNKKTFSKNEVFTLTFYLVGVANYYSEFITSYFETNEYISGFFYQKVIIENKLIQNDELYNGIIKYENVIKSQEDIIECLNYYNKKYKCIFEIPKITAEEHLININDNAKYIFNSNLFKVEGKLVKFKVENYPKILINYGIGKYAFIGGGKGKCE